MSTDSDVKLAIPDEALSRADVSVAVDALLQHAASLHCSDLFLQSDEDHLTIAVRRMGKLHRIAEVTRERGRMLIQHIKALAEMPILEQWRPQEGRWLHGLGDSRLDIRINCLATVFGTDMTLRIWDRDAAAMPLSELGILDGDRRAVETVPRRRSGLMLVTGPAGTGKTTTLYACLKFLHDGTRKINTLEEPVEFTVNGIRQTEVSERHHLGYGELLKAVLRQSPDVIMIGEIRDPETAVTAIRAAGSGHLVLASLYAPTASEAIPNLLALDVNRYFLSSCLLGILAQRLIRVLCPECRMRFDISESPQTFEDIADLLEDGENRAIYGPAGCDECFGTGYAGLTGLFEYLRVNREVREAIRDGKARGEIEAAAVRAGMIEFRRAALVKVAHGITSTEDLLRDIPAEYLGIDD